MSEEFVWSILISIGLANIIVDLIYGLKAIYKDKQKNIKD